MSDGAIGAIGISYVEREYIEMGGRWVCELFDELKNGKVYVSSKLCR